MSSPLSCIWTAHTAPRRELSPVPAECVGGHLRLAPPHPARGVGVDAGALPHADRLGRLHPPRRLWDRTGCSRPGGKVLAKFWQSSATTRRAVWRQPVVTRRSWMGWQTRSPTCLGRVGRKTSIRRRACCCNNRTAFSMGSRRCLTGACCASAPRLGSASRGDANTYNHDITCNTQRCILNLTLAPFPPASGGRGVSQMIESKAAQATYRRKVLGDGGCPSWNCWSTLPHRILRPGLAMSASQCCSTFIHMSEKEGISVFTWYGAKPCAFYPAPSSLLS